MQRLCTMAALVLCAGAVYADPESPVTTREWVGRISTKDRGGGCNMTDTKECRFTVSSDRSVIWRCRLLATMQCREAPNAPLLGGKCTITGHGTIEPGERPHTFHLRAPKDPPPPTTVRDLSCPKGEDCIYTMPNLSVSESVCWETHDYDGLADAVVVTDRSGALVVPIRSLRKLAITLQPVPPAATTD